MFQATGNKLTMRRGVLVPANTPFPVAPNEVDSLRRAGYSVYVVEPSDSPKIEGGLNHLEDEKGEIPMNTNDIPESESVAVLHSTVKKTPTIKGKATPATLSTKQNKKEV